MNNQELRWGILGLGSIAHQFVQDLQLLDNHKVVAVASRTMSKAANFAKKYKVKKHYGLYETLLVDPDVDIIYVATPHNSHAEYSIAAMEEGKHVLCEKPLAVNRKQVAEMVQAAKDNQVFLMEAFWSRFNPTIQAVLEHVKNKTIGEVNYVNVDFTFYRNDSDDSRMLNMDLAGGSLLDMGVYPVFLAYSIFGIPDQILATGRFHNTGADLQAAAIFKYKNGIANMMSGFKSQSDMVAKIFGTKGSIFIHPIWHQTQGYTILNREKGEPEVQDFSLPTKGKGFTYEIEECRQCILQKRIESELWSHQHSIDLIGIVDDMRQQMNLKYPFE